MEIAEGLLFMVIVRLDCTADYLNIQMVDNTCGLMSFLELSVLSCACAIKSLGI